MAMTGAGMKAVVKAKLEAKQQVFLDDTILQALCEGIVEYIQANAQVPVPATGLISGAPSAPVTGQATGTVT